MDHSFHHADMGHGDMDMGDRCQMNMLFTLSSKNLCIIFRQWHVRGTFSLLLSLLAIVLLTAGYEGVRELTRRYESSGTVTLKGLRPPSYSAISTGSEIADNPDNPNPNSFSDLVAGDESGSLLVAAGNGRSARARKIVLAGLYAVQVFYSFFIMLLFMTYNGWVMLSVAVGAFVGYMLFEGSTATKSVVCH